MGRAGTIGDGAGSLFFGKGQIMPATSKAQQKAAGAALSAKRGDTAPADLIGASRDMYDQMTIEQLEDLARTDHKGLPDHKQD